MTQSGHPLLVKCLLMMALTVALRSLRMRISRRGGVLSAILSLKHLKNSLFGSHMFAALLVPL
jgi:hypothetical protein